MVLHSAECCCACDLVVHHVVPAFKLMVADADCEIYSHDAVTFIFLQLLLVIIY